MKSLPFHYVQSRLLFVLSIALFIHIIAAVILVTVKIIFPTPDKSNQFHAPPITSIHIPKKEYRIHLEKLKKSMRDRKITPIAVRDLSASLQVPVIPQLSMEGHFITDISSNLWESDLAFTTDMTLPEVDIKFLFGQSIRSNRLGVIWDVSKSMHRYLPTVLQEIKTNFPNASIVLVSGSGITLQGNGQVFPVSRKSIFSQSKVYKHFNNSSFPAAVEILDQLSSTKTFFTDARLDQATHHAFTHLIDQGVDSIYWFGDFQDPIELALLNDLSKHLLDKKITVFAHHPKGQISGKKTLQHMAMLNNSLLLPSGGNQIQQPLTLK